uniref:Uncharacterized protein n=1 Tax=Panagrolaimus sp. JU765 TaxID=591449 RepID=A0AC34RSR6_9BILA
MNGKNYKAIIADEKRFKALMDEENILKEETNLGTENKGKKYVSDYEAILAQLEKRRTEFENFNKKENAKVKVNQKQRSFADKSTMTENPIENQQDISEGAEKIRASKKLAKWTEAMEQKKPFIKPEQKAAYDHALE